MLRCNCVKCRFARNPAHARRIGDMSEMAENIKVVIRLRCHLKREIDTGAKTFGNHQVNTVVGKEEVYGDDKVFGPEANTEEFFSEVVRPILEDASKGFNGSVLTYGQTKSGVSQCLEIETTRA